MREDWTGRMLGEMHILGITRAELAQEIGCTKGYVSMVLNGSGISDKTRARFEAAFERLAAKARSERNAESN